MGAARAVGRVAYPPVYPVAGKARVGDRTAARPSSPARTVGRIGIVRGALEGEFLIAAVLPMLLVLQPVGLRSLLKSPLWAPANESGPRFALDALAAKLMHTDSSSWVVALVPIRC